MRCEPTVNIVNEETGEATERVEIKNLASIRGVHDAVKYEIRRQQRAVETGEPINQETRRWSESRQETQLMRTKESAGDYMYFPDPDLVPMVPSAEWVESIRASLPELPDARRRRFAEAYGLSEYDAGVLTGTRATADYYEELVGLCKDPKVAGNWVMGDLSRALNERSLTIEESPVSPGALAELVGLVEAGKITGKIAKDVFGKMFERGKGAEQVVEEEGLEVVGDADELGAILDGVIAGNPKAVEDYKAGKRKAKGALVGGVMKATKGQADPALVNRLIDEKLGG